MKTKSKTTKFLVKLVLPFFAVFALIIVLVGFNVSRWTTAVYVSFFAVGLSLISKPVVAKVAERIEKVELLKTYTEWNLAKK